MIPLCKPYCLAHYIFSSLLISGCQGKYMDIEFDFKGDPVGGVITNCE